MSCGGKQRERNEGTNPNLIEANTMGQSMTRKSANEKFREISPRFPPPSTFPTTAHSYSSLIKGTLSRDYGVIFLGLIS